LESWSSGGEEGYLETPGAGLSLPRHRLAEKGEKVDQGMDEKMAPWRSGRWKSTT